MADFENLPQLLATSALALSVLLALLLAWRGRRAHRDLVLTESRFRRAVDEGREAELRLHAAEDHMRQSRKMEAVGRLAGGIAHDFNNLLTAINGYAELVMSRLPDGDANRPMLEEIRQAGDRAAAITRQLLTFSRKQQVSPVALDLNELVEDLDRMLARALGSDVELVTSLAPSVRPIKADPGQVGEALLNLVLNGKDAMEAGGRITVSTFDADVDGLEGGWYLKPAPGPYVCLKVEDTGRGMDDEVREHLFEPFFTTKSGERGVGLGLSAVYGILDQGRGGIRVESQEGRGTAFYAYFPAAPARMALGPSQAGEEPAEPGWAGKAPADRPAGAAGAKGTVLVVEDEENIRGMVASVLSAEGYRVLEASGAREADYIHEQHDGDIDVLLTDVIMPGRSGREIARDFQRLRPGIRIVFMSGYTDEGLLQGMESARAVLLEKPFTAAQLLGKLAEAEQLAETGA